jgi:hypothetical protein
MGARWLATPTFIERLEESKKWSRPCIAKKTTDDLFQVSMFEDRIYAAHLEPMDVEGGIRLAFPAAMPYLQFTSPSSMLKFLCMVS